MVYSTGTKIIGRLALLTLLGASLGFASEVVTNSPGWNGVSGIYYWGDGTYSYPTYGETITVPNDGNDKLNAFSLFVSGSSPVLSFQAYVQSWNGSETAGSPVYTSPVTTTSTSSAFTEYTFDPNVTLTAGGVYVLYFSTLGLRNSDNGLGFGFTTANTYSGGTFVESYVDGASPGTGSIADLDNGAWSSFSTNDLAFSATFDQPPVPEPSSAALVLIGLGALAWRVRRPA